MLDLQELGRLVSVVAGTPTVVGAPTVDTDPTGGTSDPAPPPTPDTATPADGSHFRAVELRPSHGDGPVDEVVVLASWMARRSEIEVRPAVIVDVLERLRAEGYGMLMSVHGLDYFPDEPRFGVVYELLSFAHQRRVTVKVRVPLSDPHVPSVTPNWPTASFHEREIFDMFGVIFDGHPHMHRILMPEDYLGHPQRRDFPIGGEPVLFTENEEQNPGWWK